MASDLDQHYFDRLVELMRTLRGPNGCPWDKEQTRETLKPMLVEEAFEVLEALDGAEPDELCEELGDLLFQIVFHCQISDERDEFDADEVCRRLYHKMVRRHPHVFGDASFADSQELLKNWEDIKAAEREVSGRNNRKKNSLLDGIPPGLPAMYTAYQISSKAARVGFDWPDIESIRDKFQEEFEELRAAVASKNDVLIKEEIGDLLFAALNIARFLQIDPETALVQANRKFSRRFRGMEKAFNALGRALKDVSLEEMEAVWQDLKNENPSGGESDSG